MRMRAECVPCLLKRALFEVSLVENADEYQVMRAALEVLSREFPPIAGVSNHEISTKVHEVVYQVLRTKDPYASLKKRSNEVALSMFPEVEKLVKDSGDPFKAALISSVVGNVMDFGIEGAAEGPDSLREMFYRLFDEGLGIDHTERIREKLREVRRVLYLTDNTGEIVFDRLFIREIKKFGIEITIMVKGQPILNDATRTDVWELGLDREVDRITTTESFGVGVVLSRMPPRAKREIFDAEFIISKGMGNYEALSDVKLPPIAFLLRTKCKPVAENMGFPVGINVAYLRE